MVAVEARMVTYFTRLGRYIISGKEKRIKKSLQNSKTVVKENKVGRNDACPCGSGKKYKKCCGK